MILLMKNITSNDDNNSNNSKSIVSLSIHIFIVDTTHKKDFSVINQNCTERRQYMLNRKKNWESRPNVVLLHITHTIL